MYRKRYPTQSFHDNPIKRSFKYTKTEQSSLLDLSTDILLIISTYLSQTDFFILCNSSKYFNYLLDFPYKWSTLYIYMNNPIALYIYLFKRYIRVCQSLVFIGQAQQDIRPFFDELLTIPNIIHQIYTKSTNNFPLPISANIDFISLEFPSQSSEYNSQSTFKNHFCRESDYATQFFRFIPYIKHFNYSYWQFEFYTNIQQNTVVQFGFYVNSYVVGMIKINVTKSSRYYHVNDVIHLPRPFRTDYISTLQLTIKCLTNLTEPNSYIACPLEGRITFFKHQSQTQQVNTLYPQFFCSSECKTCELE